MLAARSKLEANLAREDVLFFLGKLDGFLNAEVRHRQIEMHVGCMANRGHVSRAVPGGAHIEEFAERRKFLRRVCRRGRDLILPKIEEPPGQTVEI